jgi:hypothetical protein
MKIILMSILVSFLYLGTVHAGEADVKKVEVVKIDKRTYLFRVTIFHKDEGWNHYADKYEIVSPDGKVLGTRVLLHPHVDEQPFTRALAGVKIPEKIKEVIIRAHDSVHKYGGKTMKVPIPE